MLVLVFDDVMYDVSDPGQMGILLRIVVRKGLDSEGVIQDAELWWMDPLEFQEGEDVSDE